MTQSQIDTQFVPILEALRLKVTEYIRDGMSVDQAIKQAIKAINYNAVVSNIIIAGVLTGISESLTIVSEEVAREYALSTTYGGIKPKLSLTLHRHKREVQTILQNAIKTALKQGESWLKASKRAYDQNATAGDLPKYILEAIKGRPQDREVAKAIIERLSKRTRPTEAVRNSYSRIIKAIESGNAQQLQKAIDSAVNNKIRYATARIARTEYAYASASATQKLIDKDPDIVGYRSVLSDNRPAGFHDVCDIMARLIFPKESAVQAPYHIQCMCTVQPIYKGNLKGEFRDDEDALKKAQTWLDDQSDTLRSQIAGKSGKVADVRGWIAPSKVEKKSYIPDNVAK